MAEAATAATAAAVVAKTSARRWHEKKNQDFYEKLGKPKIAKTWKTSRKIIKSVDFGGATHKRMSPSNSTRKTTHIDLFSSLYD